MFCREPVLHKHTLHPSVDVGLHPPILSAILFAPELSRLLKGSSMKIRHEALSNPGLKRENNQDYLGIRESRPGENKGILLVVCDGMGGHTAGEVASRLGVETIVEAYFATDGDDPVTSMEQAFIEANRRIYHHGRGTMGTTGVTALLIANKVFVANVGDSRAYLIREGAIQQISTDHSFVAEQVAAGLLTPEEARVSSYRNMITRALGHQNEVQVDIFALPVRQGDVVVLSTDGLHGVVEDAEIAQVVSTMPPDQAVQQLVDMANERGGPDNITVIVARVDELDDRNRDTTEEITEPLPVGFQSVSSAPSPESADAPAAPGALPLPERPLSRAGLWLASLTLALLVLLGGFALALPADGFAPGLALPPPATFTPGSTPDASPNAAPAVSPATTRVAPTPTGGSSTATSTRPQTTPTP